MNGWMDGWTGEILIIMLANDGRVGLECWRCEFWIFIYTPNLHNIVDRDKIRDTASFFEVK